MSIGQFVLAGTWLVHTIAFNNLKYKLWAYFTNKQALALGGVLFMLVVGLLYSDNMKYGLKDLQIKLPLFLVPFLALGLGRLRHKEYIAVLWLIIVATLASAGAGTLININNPEYMTNPRILSPFISHIRLSLLCGMCVFICIYFIWYYKKWLITLLLSSVALLLLGYMVALEAITGLIITFLCATGLTYWAVFNTQHKAIKWVAGLLPILLVLFGIGWVNKEYRFYNTPKTVVKATTINGNAYLPLTDSIVENGSYVFANWQPLELEKAWAARCPQLPLFDSLNNNKRYMVLIRYLNSKNLTKDSAGVAALNPYDIANIKQGLGNSIYAEKRGIRARLYKIFWEFKAYKAYNKPMGFSVIMRWIFWQNAWAVLTENPLIGVGTGDVEDALKQSYAKRYPHIAESWQLHAHNQFLEIGIGLGYLGMVAFILLLVYVVWATPKPKGLLYSVFVAIVVCSMFTEDTLETQAGVTFYIFYFTLFLFLKPNQNSPSGFSFSVLDLAERK